MAYCKNCGSKLEDGTKFCPKCGCAVNSLKPPNEEANKAPSQERIVYVQSQQQDIYVHERKSKGLAMTLCFFLGWMGAHEFYLRKYLSGSLYLIFFWSGIPFLLSILDFILLLLTPKSAFHKMYDK